MRTFTREYILILVESTSSVVAYRGSGTQILCKPCVVITTVEKKADFPRI